MLHFLSPGPNCGTKIVMWTQLILPNMPSCPAIFFGRTDNLGDLTSYVCFEVSLSYLEVTYQFSPYRLLTCQIKNLSLKIFKILIPSVDLSWGQWPKIDTIFLESSLARAEGVQWGLWWNPGRRWFGIGDTGRQTDPNKCLITILPWSFWTWTS